MEKNLKNNMCVCVCVCVFLTSLKKEEKQSKERSQVPHGINAAKREGNCHKM